MANVIEVIEALSNTAKGQLKYYTSWLADGDIDTVLEDCSSPPTIGFRSPPKVIVPPLDEDNEENSSPKFNRHGGGDATTVHSSPKNERNKETGTGERSLSEGSDGHSIISPEVIKSELAIKDYEESWNNRAKMSLEARKRLFKSHSKMLGQEAESEVLDLYIKQEEFYRRTLEKGEEESKASKDAMEERRKQMKEHHQKHAMMLDAKMKEAEKRKRQLADAARKKQMEEQERLNQLQSLGLEMVKLKDGVQQAVTSCKHKQLLPETLKKYQDVFMQIFDCVDKIVQESKAGCTAELLKTTTALVAKARGAHDFVKKCTEEANRVGGEEEAKKASAAAQATAAANAAAQAAATAANAAASTGAQVSNVSQAQGEVLCVMSHTFVWYEKLQSKLTEVQKESDAIMNNPQLKKYKFDLQKAVNTPVNAIAPTSGAHLRDKLQRICTLLSGQPADVGTKKVSARDHPAGVLFCKNLFASKIVKQGDEQVSASHESAFAIAAVVVGVWGVFPDVGDLVLAHFHTKCPYIVPYYVPKVEGQSSEEHYRALGYNYKDGEIEKQDKFLKRMTGVMRLYASIMVAPPLRGEHPHGIENAWRWLTEIMNLEPRPDITATMTFDLLEVTANTLFRNYGKQFVKLIQIFRADFLPRIAKVTPEGSGGPTRRLENFLDSIIRKGVVDPPSGVLSTNFWYT